MKTTMKTRMKTTMKFFAALAIMMSFTMGAMAQSNTSNASIDGKAQVIAAIKVEAGNSLQFGVVTQNYKKTIGNDGLIKQGTFTATATNGLEQAGTFTVTKGKNTLVTLEFGFPAEGVLKHGTDNLSINFTDYDGHNLAKLTGADSEFPFDPNVAFAINNSDAVLSQYFAIGSFTVNIGGTVEPTDDQAQGEYTGGITLTATYN